MPINVLCLSLKDSSNEDCVFVGFMRVHDFLGLLMNELLQLEIMKKPCLVQNITNIIPVADE